MEGEYTVHQIQPGESLSKVAQIYYGDYQLFHVIARYNGIADPTSIKVGQKIKVPRLENGAALSLERPYRPEQAEAVPDTPYATRNRRIRPSLRNTGANG